MFKLIFVVFSALVCSQIRGDEVDELHAKYLQQLKDIAAQSDAAILEAETSLDETDLYMSHSIDVFGQTGAKEISDQQSSVNSTAADLTLAAITNNKPASVLTCINTQRENGINSLAGLVSPFNSKLESIYSASSAEFSTQRNTISLIKGQLPTLFQTNSDKLDTCVVEACFVSNIEAAQKQYSNLNNSLTTIVASVNDKRSKFNEDVINQLNNIRTDAQSAVDNAVKKMGKC